MWHSSSHLCIDVLFTRLLLCCRLVVYCVTSEVHEREGCKPFGKVWVYGLIPLQGSLPPTARHVAVGVPIPTAILSACALLIFDEYRRTFQYRKVLVPSITNYVANTWHLKWAEIF